MTERREFIEEMLDTFSQAIQKKSVTKELTDAYDRALRPYSLHDIRRAAYICLDNCRYFPKIPELIGELHVISRDNNATRQQGFELSYQRCERCGAGPTNCGRDGPKQLWECQQCYTGLTTEEIKARFDEIHKILRAKKPNF